MVIYFRSLFYQIKKVQIPCLYVNAVYLSDSSETVWFPASSMLVFLAISHHIIPSVAPLLCLSSSTTTQLHFRMWGRKMAVRGNSTTPPPTPPTSPTSSRPAAGFQFHAMRESHPWVQSSCEESMRIFPASARMMQSNVHITEKRFIFSSFNVIHMWKKCFHLCTCEPLKPQHWHTNLPFIILWWHQAYDPLPPNPCHPKHNTIFQGNWVNQWNQDELIILINLLSVIF